MPADDVLPWKLLLSKLRRSDDSRVSYDEVLRTGWQPEVLVVRERVLEYGKADDYEPPGCINGCLPNVNYDVGAAEGLVAVACPEEPPCWPGWTMVPRTEVEALRSMTYRSVSRTARTGVPSSEASLIRTVRVGIDGWVFPRSGAAFVWTRSRGGEGGASVQRNESYQN